MKILFNNSRKITVLKGLPVLDFMCYVTHILNRFLRSEHFYLSYRKLWYVYHCSCSPSFYLFCM